MITLITGAPGAGKTALLVEWLRTLYTDRPLYVHGLNGLTLDHEPVNGADWHNQLPDGAILVIDEVQQVWRPRGPGHAAPESVQKLETHRHRGIDVFLTTQKPNLLDANVRGLVGRHVHLRDTGWLGRWLYEWPECSENLAWKTCAVKRRYTLPKKAFTLYKSASLHMSAEKTKSKMVYITVGLLALTALLVFMVYRSINRHLQPQQPAQEAAQAAPQPAGQVKPAAVADKPSLRDSWPVYEASSRQRIPDPYAGRAFQFEGKVEHQGGGVEAFFGMLLDGRRVATVTLAELVRVGYAWTELGPCAGVLRYEERERLITCPTRQEVDQRGFDRAARPDPAASSAGLVS